jgi:hypothetical protein
MTGQSSARTTWCMPIVYQSTMSVSSMLRFAARPLRQPLAGPLSVGYMPAAKRSSARWA